MTKDGGILLALETRCLTVVPRDPYAFASVGVPFERDSHRE
jgi:hypothetical protein